MKILITVSNFRFLTGAEIYVYELARELKARGHEVVIVSYIGGELTKKMEEAGVKCYDFTYMNDKELPFKPDIIHSQQEMPTQFITDRHPNVPVVKTIHSWYETEKKFTHPRVSEYIYVHTETLPYLLEAGIPEQKCTLIRNGIDFSRFNKDGITKRPKKTVLFAGTVDPFRKEAAHHLMRESQMQDFNVQFIGHRFDSYLDSLPPNVEYLDAVWNIEEYVKQADEVAGIVFGRWMIEGWACGKTATLYQIGQDGMIKDIQRLEPPADMTQFDIKFMTDRIIEIYQKALPTFI